MTNYSRFKLTKYTPEGNNNNNSKIYHYYSAIPEGFLKCAKKCPTPRTIKAFQRIAGRRGISPESAIALLGGGENE